MRYRGTGPDPPDPAKTPTVSGARASDPRKRSAQAIATVYPDAAAVGYNEGEMCGAFTLTRPI